MTDSIRTVAVLGAGTMGQGIAQVCAAAGFATRVFDASTGKAEQAIASIGGQLERLVGKGKLADAQRTAALSSLSPAATLAAACQGVDLVIEAAPENMELKVAILAEVVAHAPPRALLGIEHVVAVDHRARHAHRRRRAHRRACTSSTRRR